ncbi:hypothetical protein [Microbulbifer litoralis]|nr:hypothetical protein [Microbulbifer sp. GX H0434]
MAGPMPLAPAALPFVADPLRRNLYRRKNVDADLTSPLLLSACLWW